MDFSSHRFLIISSLVIIFSMLTYILSWYQSRYTIQSKTNFLVANRNLSYFESSFSIAATWIWAPALFISSQKAYLNGWQGLFWFLVPNVLCLILFSYFANIIRKSYPNGFTLSDVMRQRHSSRVQNIYWFTTIGLTICAYAVQLLAGGKLITMILGYPFWLSTVVLSVIPLGYSMIFGIRASVMTDYLKMIIMIVLGAILLPLVVIKSGGIDVIIAGLGGVNGNFSNMMTSDGLTLFLTFGIPTFIGLMSGPFGDQSFWQRTFATKQSEIKKSFITGAFIFAIVPLMMGVVGFAAAGSGLKIDDPQMVNIQTIFASAGLIGVALFLIIVMSALTSIIDSKLCAISSIAGHDMSERFNLDFNILSKASMVWLTLGALLVANIPGLQILYLFLFYGTLRSSTVSITVLTLMGKKMSEVRVFYGILAAIAIGLPLFTYGNLNKNTIFIVAGSLITVLLPLIALKKHDK